MIEKRLENLFQSFPQFFSVVKLLNVNNIQWAIGGSACLYVFGNERFPDDLDIFLADSDHDKADKIFDIKSFTYSSAKEVVRNSNPHKDHSLQLTSSLLIINSEQTINFSLTSEILNFKKEGHYGGEKVYFLPPEEPLIIKSFLNRGSDVGKHDAEDIKNFLKIYEAVDYDYIEKRLTSLNILNKLDKLKYCDFLFKNMKLKNEKHEVKNSAESPLKHYYGDIIRKLFLAIALLMVVAYPVFTQFINLPHYLPILAVVIVVLLAGFQNPLHYFVPLINTLAAVAGFIIFEYKATIIYLNAENYSLAFFWTNQILAVLFLIAVYFCSKTLRGMYFSHFVITKK